MPVMLPPGQGVTVTVPTPTTALGTQPQNPEPFRQVQGPDVALLPHTEDRPQTQPQPPA